MTRLNLTYTEASKLADSIYEWLDYFGIAEIDYVIDVLTGDIKIEEFMNEADNIQGYRESARSDG